MFEFYKRIYCELNDSYNDLPWFGYVYLPLSQSKPSKDEDYYNFYHIQDMTNYHKKDRYKSSGKEIKKYSLLIERSEIWSDDLQELENKLFEWIKGEVGLIDYRIIWGGGVESEFPDYDDLETYYKARLDLSLYGFEDQCWHNEAMPHLCKPLDDEDNAIRFWIDFKDHKSSDLRYDKKEDEPYLRYFVERSEYGCHDTRQVGKNFDNYDDAIHFVKCLVKSCVYKVEWKEGYPEEIQPEFFTLKDFMGDEWNLKSYNLSVDDIEGLLIGHSMDSVGVTDRITITRIGGI